MAHIVKCFYCGKSFDREKEDCIKVNARRYAHAACAENQDKETLQIEKDKAEFYKMVKSIYGTEYNYVLINRQATNFIEQYGYTWSGMTKCLHWFYNIKHGSKEESNGGIGIIPYIYEEVRKYYYDIYLAQNKNKNKKTQKNIININIPPPKFPQKPIKLIDMENQKNE